MCVYEFTFNYMLCPRYQVLVNSDLVMATLAVEVLVRGGTTSH